jgi:thymidylate kinase
VRRTCGASTRRRTPFNTSTFRPSHAAQARSAPACGAASQTRRTGAGGGFDPAALALLFAADRLDHHAVEIAPKLAEGIDLVSDRYTLSSLPYQGLALYAIAWLFVLT